MNGSINEDITNQIGHNTHTHTHTLKNMKNKKKNNKKKNNKKKKRDNWHKVDRHQNGEGVYTPEWCAVRFAGQWLLLASLLRSASWISTVRNEWMNKWMYYTDRMQRDTFNERSNSIVAIGQWVTRLETVQLNTNSFQWLIVSTLWSRRLYCLEWW